MSNLRSLIKRTMHLELECFVHFWPAVLLLAALAVFPGIPIIARASSASVSTLPTILWKAVTKSGTPDGGPLLNPIVNILTHALNTLLDRGLGRPRGDDTHAITHAECVSRVAIAIVYSGKSALSAPSKISAASRDGTVIPLVTPPLLLLYRGRGGGKHTSRETDVDAQEGRKAI
ncbi:hypothetical protein L210DRAFT_987630 [Boletus edulis BED1]|uniref:Uncharacterized protein n=1 Tax=Boletus edulis BED1 TaxID=1328754 RepID=A0AAD4BPH7_BOLED|nr:hypothetical protein L210DRAFT_987630 [Boletus edulis BED1]